MGEGKSEVLQGTLDLMVLKTLYAMGPLHGFGIARRIEQVSDGVLDLNEGTVHGVAAAATARMDLFEVGKERKQSAGAFLLRHPAGCEAAGTRNRKLGAGSGRHGEGAQTREAGVRLCRSCGCCGRE